MLDLRYLRDNTETAKAGLATKGVDETTLDDILELDKQRREVITQVEKKKQDRNNFSQEVNKLKKNGQDAGDIIEKTRNIGREIKQLEEQLKAVQEKLDDLLDRLPNIPHSSAPVGKNEADNVTVRCWGEPVQFDFTAKDHLAVGEKLDLFDFPRGSKVTGRGFPFYKGYGARLERALISFMLEIHQERHGYLEVIPPFVANRASMRGTGQLPKMEEDMYFINEDDLFLIPTAEVSVTNMHRDEIIGADELPIKYCAYSPCFRREAGSWGKDTRGFLRLHQFNKVEMVKFVHPDSSYQELELLVKDACTILEMLNIHYRVIELCTGDLSFAAAKCYDIEAWSPAEENWLEVSSCSNFEDFQARRMNIRYRSEAGKKPEFLHTLNGSGLATPRLLVALLENNQTKDGSVVIPEVLRKYTGFDRITAE